MAYDHCINFKGHIGNAGYGLAHEPTTRKTVLAHRKAYMDVHGPIPKGLVVMHSCNNKRCVNLAHLVVGTQSQNVLQSYKDGLQVNPLRKLTDEQVVQILNDKASQRNIAKRFGISQRAVGFIKHGVTYKHITGGGSCGV